MNRGVLNIVLSFSPSYDMRVPHDISFKVPFFNFDGGIDGTTNYIFF
jgi:hypothetical protein